MPFDPNNPDPVYMAGCPFHWQGDQGALNWLGELYQDGFNEGAGSAPPPPAPEIPSQGS